MWFTLPTSIIRSTKHSRQAFALLGLAGRTHSDSNFSKSAHSNSSSSDGNFTADIIGTWQVNLTSAFGLDANTTVTVVYGAIDYLEISVSATTITADDLIWLNTTRVDVRGNRMVVDLPAENWTVSNGLLTPKGIIE